MAKEGRRRPEVVAEETHYGPVVDVLVEQARHDQRDYGVNADYDVAREGFDHYHYLLQAALAGIPVEVDPIRHFLWGGAHAPLSPHPDFSMRRYLERHPQHDPARSADVAERSPYLEWVKRGRAAGELADPTDGVEAWASILGRTPADVVADVVEIRTDMLHRLRHGVLGEMYAKAAHIEPLIAETWPETTQAKILPQRGEFVARAVAAIHASQAAAGHRRARVLVVTDGAEGVGAELVAAMVGALAGTVAPEDVVVLRTDHPTSPYVESRLPAGVRAVDFGPTKVSPDLLEPALVALVRSFCADVVVCVDSALLLSAMTSYGKALAASERLVLAFADEGAPTIGGSPAFAFRWVYSLAAYAEELVVEGEAMKETLVEQFRLEPHTADTIRVWDPRGERFADEVRELLLAEDERA